MKVAGQIIFFFWLFLLFPGLLLGFLWFGLSSLDEAIREPFFWIVVLFPLPGIYLWRKGRELEISPEELKKYR